MADEITIKHDELIGNHAKWAADEMSSNSDAGMRRQEIGEFADKCGVEGKALSMMRQGLKIKNEGKQADWLRSMEAMLPMVAAHIRGQSTAELPLEGDEPLDTPDDKSDVVKFGDAAE